MRDYQTKGCTKYGAQMGRRSSLDPDTLDPDTDEKLRLYRVPINSQGYDPGGAYWGIGKPLYCAENPDGEVAYLRAQTRDAAKARFPNARFYR